MVGDDQAAVAFRAATAELALFDNGDLPSFMQQEVGNESADNAATDNDNFILFHIWLDKPQRCNYGVKLSSNLLNCSDQAATGPRQGYFFISFRRFSTKDFSFPARVQVRRWLASSSKISSKLALMP